MTLTRHQSFLSVGIEYWVLNNTNHFPPFDSVSDTQRRPRTSQSMILKKEDVSFETLELLCISQTVQSVLQFFLVL